MQPRGYSDDTIDVRAYIEVLIGKKKMILGVFLVCVALAVVFSFLMPKVYEISVILKPPLAGIQQMEARQPIKFEYLDTAEGMAKRINAGIYDREVAKALNLPLEESLDFSADAPEKADYVRIILEVPEAEVERGLSALNALSEQLKKEYAPIIQAEMERIDIQISFEEIRIDKIELEKQAVEETVANDIELKLAEKEKRENQISSYGSSIKLAEGRITLLLGELARAKSNTEDLREKFLKEKGEIDSLSAILYSTSIQQAVAYFNQLDKQLNLERLQQESMQGMVRAEEGEIEVIKIQIAELKMRGVKELEKDIENGRVQIDGLERSKGLFHNVGQLRAPEASRGAIKPKKVQNVAIAMVLGSMLGVFIAVFQDFWGKSGQRPPSREGEGG